MKLCVVSTTIRGEKGYLPFDKLAKESKFSEIFFIISGDKKSPSFNIRRFSCGVEYLDVRAQSRFKCSESIGWNKIMRRNTALLRAIEMDPDYILMIDDDNVPKKNYFNKWYEVLSKPVKKSVRLNKKNIQPVWFNYLSTSNADIVIYPRGFPIPYRRKNEYGFKFIKDNIPASKVGLFQGVSLGDPDIDALTRIVYPKPISKIKEKNYCLKDIWSSYNTQNTVLARFLFPLGFVWPYSGRYDDIYASFTWQKLLFNNDKFVHIGDSINTQNRGMRNNLKDFNDEVEGYLTAHEVWEMINTINEKDAIKFLIKLSKIDHVIIRRQRKFMQEFLQDLKKCYKS